MPPLRKTPFRASCYLNYFLFEKYIYLRNLSFPKNPPVQGDGGGGLFSLTSSGRFLRKICPHLLRILAPGPEASLSKNLGESWHHICNTFSLTLRISLKITFLTLMQVM